MLCILNLAAQSLICCTAAAPASAGCVQDTHVVHAYEHVYNIQTGCALQPSPRIVVGDYDFV
jgi:hypothetical protein